MHCNEQNISPAFFFSITNTTAVVLFIFRDWRLQTSMVCSGKMDRLVHCWNTFQFALFGIRVKGNEKYFSSKEFDFNFK